MQREHGGPPGDLTVLAGGAFMRRGRQQATGAIYTFIIVSGVQNGVAHPEAL